MRFCSRTAALGGAVALFLAGSFSASQTVSASPSTLSFGSQVINTTSAVHLVTLKNGLTTPLTITSITSNLADFADTSACPIGPGTLRAGASCQISVTFTPSVLGGRSASLTIADNASNSPQVVKLTGTGVVAVTLTPSVVGFASQALGTSSPPSLVTLKNNQATPLTITTIATTLSDYTESTTCPLSPGTLAAGGTCTISVVFAPAVLGTRAATLSVTDSASNSPQAVSLSGKGTAAVLVSLAVTPNPVSIAMGATQQFTATGTYSNGTTQNLTKSVQWTSSLVSVATISSGLATSTGQGSTIITAVSGTISGSASLQVTPPPLVGLAVTPASASIALGTSQQFTATGTYADGSTQNLTSSVTWNSSTPAVASINTGGLAASLSQGSSTITGSTGGFSASATLTVGQPLLTSVAVTPANPSFALGTTQNLKATGSYSDGSTQDLTGLVSWNSANPAVATVNSQGVVSGAATGASTITASSGSIAGSATVTVTPAALVSIAVTPAIPVIPTGSTQAFVATGTYTDGTTQNITNTAQWNSDTTAVATISNQAGSQGLASALGAGTATISATSGSVTGSTVLTVPAATLVSIAVTPGTPSIALGTSQQFTATGTYGDGSTQNLTTTAAWSSGTPSTATITSTGFANSVGAGTATISAVLGTVTGSTFLTVTPATLASIAVTPSLPSIAAGTLLQFAATGTFTDGSSQDLTQAAYWSSSAAGVATISDASGSQGLATTWSPGGATISATYGAVNGAATLTVTPANLLSIAVSPPSASIALGTTQWFTATGTYSDGSTQNLTGTAGWSSSSASVAIVSNDPATAGLSTSAGEGTATISATLGSVSGSAQITVGAPSLVSIAVSPANVSIALGATQQFTATGRFTDGSTQDLTQSGYWSSSAPAVATISDSAGSQGLAAAVNAGTTVIAVSSAGITGTANLTVNAISLVSIAITPQSAAIAVGTAQQFTATGTYSDGSTQTLTNSVTWTSSASSVATISPAGLATTGTAGATTIGVSLGSVSSSTALSVGLGSVTGVSPVACSTGFAANAQCSKATVSCPGTADLQFTYGVEQGTGAGTIVIFNGASGTVAGGSNYVAAFHPAGFTTIQVAWALSWQDTGLTTKSILTAACRPATVGQYLYSTFHTTGGFGVLAGSAGAGAVGYWLAWYGGGNLIDNAELSSGPVYSDIQQGCEVPGASSFTIVPTDGASWADTINFRGGAQNGLSTQTGYTCRPSSGNTSTTANTAWLAQSVIQPGWTSSYPNTNVSGWVCNNSLNNSEAEAWLFFSQIRPPFSLTAISGCPDAETVENGYTPQGVLGSTAIINDMLAQCFDRHSH